jgi:hypothetical protein
MPFGDCKCSTVERAVQSSLAAHYAEIHPENTNQRGTGMAKGMKAVKKAVKKSKDDFENGTIVAWTASDKYSYAAIKTPVGWYTTASDRAAWTVEKIITFKDVLKILSRKESTNVRVIGVNDGTKVEED